MALETEIRLVCDQCKEASEYFDGAIFTRTMMIQELRAGGWVYGSRGGRLSNAGDKCPSCSSKKAGR